MNLDDIYKLVKLRRSGLKANQFRHKRVHGDRWQAIQKEAYARADGLCQSPLKFPVCQGKHEPLGRAYHVDHIQPLTCGGTNHIENLRILCPVCHSLRADRHHEGLRGKMIKLNKLPDNWPEFLWEG